MTFAGAIRSVLGNDVNFEGSAPRAEDWWWQLAMRLVGLLVSGFSESANPFAQCARLVGLLRFRPSLAVAISRLHDTDRSGWFILLVFVPLIGTLILPWPYLEPGTPGPNRFGPDPRMA